MELPHVDPIEPIDWNDPDAVLVLCHDCQIRLDDEDFETPPLGVVYNAVMGLRADLAEARRKIAYYEGRTDRGETLYELVAGKDAPRHLFTDEGLCIRCGEDAEEWDAGCVEALVRDLAECQSKLATLSATLDGVLRADAERGTLLAKAQGDLVHSRTMSRAWKETARRQAVDLRVLREGAAKMADELYRSRGNHAR